MLQFIRRRLAGTIPLAEAFFTEMLVIGSMVNIAIALCAFAMIAADLPVWMPIAVFLAPLPYNAVLVISVWRSAQKAGPTQAGLVRGVAVVWFVLMIVV
ncbi:MAG: hypothetical protein ACK4IB_01735 [Erythrobacter sp.]